MLVKLVKKNKNAFDMKKVRLYVTSEGNNCKCKGVSNHNCNATHNCNCNKSTGQHA